jgi:hypothetical protein
LKRHSACSSHHACGRTALIPILMVASFCLSSCRKFERTPANAYDLQRLHGMLILFPPAVHFWLTSSALQIRTHTPNPLPASCGTYNFNSDSIAIGWHRSIATIRVSRDLLKIRDYGEPLSELRDFSALRQSLWRFAVQCSRIHGQMIPLLATITESVPLPPSTASDLQSGRDDEISGSYQDVSQFSYLKLVNALFPCRARSSASRLKPSGFETSYYKPVGTAEQGFQLQLAVSQRLVARGPCGRTLAPALPEAFIEHPTHLRVFFFTGGAPEGHNIILLGAPTIGELETFTRSIEHEPGVCPGLRSDGAACFAVPRLSALSTVEKVEVNGHRVLVPAGATVTDAMHDAGQDASAQALRDLRVWRPYGNHFIPVRFDRNQNDILHLVLVGGERIQWRPELKQTRQ